MCSDELETQGDSGDSDESLEIRFLPDIAERLETLRQANLALERARVLLEKLRAADDRPRRVFVAVEPDASTGAE